MQNGPTQLSMRTYVGLIPTLVPALNPVGIARFKIIPASLVRTENQPYCATTAIRPRCYTRPSTAARRSLQLIAPALPPMVKHRGGPKPTISWLYFRPRTLCSFQQ